MSDNFSPYQEQEQKIVIEQKQSNPLGITGFILSICSLITLICMPFLNILFLILISIIGVLSFIFSLIGLFKQPKGFAIAGLIISIISFIVTLATIIFNII